MATKKARKKTSAKKTATGKTSRKRTSGIGARAKRSMGKVLVGAAIGAAAGAVRGAVQAGNKELGIRRSPATDPEMAGEGRTSSPSPGSRTSRRPGRSTKK
jgi:hypothetical protein